MKVSEDPLECALNYCLLIVFAVLIDHKTHFEAQGSR